MTTATEIATIDAATELLPAVQALDAEVLQVQQVTVAPITSVAEYEDVARYRKDTLKPLRKRVADGFQSIEKPFRDALDNVRKIRQGRLDQIDRVIAAFDKEILAYDQRVRREIEEAAKKARAEAEARRFEEAALLADAGQEERAEKLLAAPFAAVVEAPVPKVAGLSTRTTVSAEVTDAAAFLRWCCENVSRAERFLTINQTALTAFVRAAGDSVSIPGVRRVEKKGVASR